MKRIGMLLLCLALCGAAIAQTASAVRKRAEASMVVNGHIVLAPDGSVRSCTLDQQDQLPVPVVDLVKRNSATWRFQPVLADGVAVAAEAPMHLRVVATPSGDGDTFNLRIVSGTFSNGQADKGLAYKNRTPPRYPQDAVQARVSGTVFLLVRVQPDGTVGDVAAEQVNLNVADSENGMRRWRKLLAASSIEAARNWTFTVPANGPGRNGDAWIVRVPVAYHLRHMGDSEQPESAAWQAYIPGPKEPIPWMDEYRRTHKDESLGADALPDGSLYLVGSGLHLTTPLDRS
ncbi:energy transducer TonB [Dyella sp. 2RAB6]|uniref:energy transducer TonB n=1 Tax=Dyella sp. 2RAB6 TaxID=3232992 RepID=UPI003F922520